MMKRKLSNFLRIAALVLVLVLALLGLMQLSARHEAAFPASYADGAQQGFLPLVMLLLLYALYPLVQALVGKLCGYRVQTTYILFLHIVWGKKVCLGRPSFGTTMLPPRVDGTSPFLLPMLLFPLYQLGVSVLLLLLSFPLWPFAARQLHYLSFVFLVLALVALLPRKNGMDVPSMALRMCRSRDLVRAWECTMHISAALQEDQKLTDMPDEWFQTYPAELAADYYVPTCMVNGSSRLIRQGRYAEAYEMLRPLFRLKPTPDTHQIIACAILNGAICEAMAEDENGSQIPPMCLEQLDHQSVQYMTPPNWQPRLTAAKYARALFVTHDEAEAAALLPAIGKAIAEDQLDGMLIQRMQAKAGIVPDAGGEEA